MNDRDRIAAQRARLHHRTAQALRRRIGVYAREWTPGVDPEEVERWVAEVLRRPTVYPPARVAVFVDGGGDLPRLLWEGVVGNSGGWRRRATAEVAPRLRPGVRWRVVVVRPGEALEQAIAGMRPQVPCG